MSDEFNPFETATVKIASDDHEGGFLVINKADFDAKVHQLFDQPKGKKTVEASAKDDDKKADKGDKK